MPTVSGAVSFTGIAKACGYEYTADIEDETALRIELEKAKEQKELTFLCVHCALGSREDLGRPTTSAQDNKASFMAHLREL